MAIRGSDKIRHKRTLTNSQTLRQFGDRMPARSARHGRTHNNDFRAHIRSVLLHCLGTAIRCLRSGDDLLEQVDVDDGSYCHRDAERIISSFHSGLKGQHPIYKIEGATFVCELLFVAFLEPYRLA